jgi:glyoxylase-like metal-dependent hydrolase (beta-lactamase superfamily II)
VVVTHHHEDHAGNLARLQAGGDQVLLAPAESLELLADGFSLQTYRRIIWGRPGLVRAEPLPASLPLAAGGALQPVLLPGHSPDMTCLIERSRGLLFGADLYISSRPRYLRQDEDLVGILQSMRRALTLDFDTLLCSHRGILPDAKQALRRKLDYLLSLGQQASDLHSQGIGLRSITRRLLGREGSVALISSFHFSKRNLIRECLRAAGRQSPTLDA